MSKTFYVFDGNSFAYRSFYGVPPMTASGGVEVHAVYGFFNTLKKVIKEKDPDYIAAAFDFPGPTFRHKKFKAYKEKRQKTPESLIEQIKMIKSICQKGGIALIEEENYEADDIMAAIAAKYASRGMRIFLLTGDKDMVQAVNNNVSIIKTVKHKEIIMTPEYVEKEMGIRPGQIKDVLALMGDASDNIPGVKGIGEKTAYKLIQEFETVENLARKRDEIKNERVKKLVNEGLEAMKVSKELVTLDFDPGILDKSGFDIKKCAAGDIKRSELDKEFLKLNFKSLVSDGAVKNSVKKRKKSKPVIIEKFNEVSFGAEKKPAVIFFAFDGGRPEMIFFEADAGYFIVFTENLKEVPDLSGKEIITNSAKEIFRYGFSNTPDKIYDVGLMAYLLDPEKNHGNISHTFMQYTAGNFLSYEEVVGRGAKKIMPALADAERLVDYTGAILENAGELKAVLEKELKEKNMTEVYSDMEVMLARVLVGMEENGLKIDVPFLEDLSGRIEKKIKTAENKIKKISGSDFNINSPKQLAKVLFEDMGIPAGKKTKTGYSTDNEVLKELEGSFEITGQILKYRMLAKLKSGFLDVLRSYAGKSGIIHPVYNQSVTATGRLSSSNPNIQNIPIRGEEGREIRKAFVPLNSGEVLLRADYSQVELRIMAHLSSDEKMIKAFEEGIDIHSLAASGIFGVDAKDITKEMRRAAKTINFGIIYGISPYGLAKQLKVSHYEAGEYIKRFFEKFPDVKKFQEETIKSAGKNGYVETLMGRRRYVENINGRNRMQRELAERAAVNAPVQGTAADIIKKAMLDIDGEIRKNKMSSKMILQVHDELVFSCPVKEAQELKKIAEEKMTSAVRLKVKLDVDMGTGRNWNECG